MDIPFGTFWSILTSWLDRSVVRVRVSRLVYHRITNDRSSRVRMVTPYPSRYEADIEFAHRGRPTSIKSVELVVNKCMVIKAAGYTRVKLEHGDYFPSTLCFPVQPEVAIEQGDFEIRAFDAFSNKAFKHRGRFPIRQRTPKGKASGSA